MNTVTNNQMTDYSHPKYKGLYEEILLDYHYRFPKFHPIPYPNFPNSSPLINNERTSILRKRNRNPSTKTT